MSREIKFKCWDNSRKEMLGNIRPSDGLGGNFNFNDIVFLQFTGLKDKNSVELFDGDIYVKWGDVFECKFEQVTYEKMNCLIFEGGFEIIGNIYENPELLES